MVLNRLQRLGTNEKLMMEFKGEMLQIFEMTNPDLMYSFWNGGKGRKR